MPARPYQKYDYTKEMDDVLQDWLVKKSYSATQFEKKFFWKAWNKLWKWKKEWKIYEDDYDKLLDIINSDNEKWLNVSRHKQT